MEPGTTTSPAASSDQRLWDQEVEKIRAQREAMTPAVAAAVQAVLQSIAGEQTRRETFALSARELLEEMSEAPGAARMQRLGTLRLRAA